MRARRKQLIPARMSTVAAMTELEILADEALKTARAIKESVALLRAQDRAMGTDKEDR